MHGPVEVDETYIGGKEANKNESRKLKAGRGPVGKTAVVGMRDRETGAVAARPMAYTDKDALQGFIVEHTDSATTVYTDEAAAYHGMPRFHRPVKHSVREYVNGMAHTNGIESVWAVLKRGYNGVYHQWSVKHMTRYVNEFSFRLNQGNVSHPTMKRLESLSQKSGALWVVDLYLPEPVGIAHIFHVLPSKPRERTPQSVYTDKRESCQGAL